MFVDQSSKAPLPPLLKESQMQIGEITDGETVKNTKLRPKHVKMALMEKINKLFK